MDLRSRLLLVAVLPLLAVATLAGQPAVVLAPAALATAGAVGAGVWFLTAGFGRLQTAAAALHARLERAAASGHAAGGFPTEGTDGTGAVGRALAAAEETAARLGRVVRDREAELRAGLAVAADAMEAMTARQPPAPVALDGTAPAERRRLAAAAAKLWESHSYFVRRSSVLHAALQDVPDPLLAIDANTFLVAPLNRAAEELFPFPAARRRAHVEALFAAPAAADVPEHDAAPVADAAGVREWVARGAGGVKEAVAAADAGVPVQLLVVPKRERASSAFVTVLVRDVSHAREAEADSRRRQRQLVGQRLCRLLTRETKPGVEVVRTQANLLSQAAKQAGLRDRFLPKVSRILEEVGRQELVVDLLDWLGRLSAHQHGEPVLAEVRLGEVTDGVADRLRAPLDERGNRLEVDEAAGWVLADEEWLAMLLTGVLAHANQAVERAEVRLTLRRRTAVQADSESVELTVQYPAAAPAAHLLADIRDPFRRPDSAVFDPDRPGGLLLGLAVAHKITALIGGEFAVAAAGPAATEVRAVFPTRAGRPVAARLASPPDAAAATQDTLSGWSVGGLRPADPPADPTSDTAVIHRKGADAGRTPGPRGDAAAAGVPVSDDAPLPDETLGSFFGPAD